MAKRDKKTEEVAASKDAAANPVENVQDTKSTDTKAQQEADAKAKKEAKAKPAIGYAFTVDAPESIRYNGEVHTQEEVLNNPELLHELVTGKCIFIKKA